MLMFNVVGAARSANPFSQTKYAGTLTSVAVSLSAVPLLLRVTTYPALPEPFAMTSMGFVLLAGIAGFFTILLPPSGVAKRNSLSEGRGILYYSSCLFMWACIADLTVESSKLGIFSSSRSASLFSFSQTFYETPHGVASKFWNGIVHYCLHLVIIFKIDNGQDPRNFVLYWCGSILTNQLVTLIGALTGSCSLLLQNAVWMNVAFILFPVWVLFTYLVKSRNDLPPNKNFTTKYRVLDICLCASLVAASIFSFFRGFGALNSEFRPIRSYAKYYEPYILEPTNFGAAWVLCAAVYGVPFQVAAIYGLLRPGKQWMLNLSVVYAAAMLQGTFTFVIYSWFPSAKNKFKIPKGSLSLVLSTNISLVVMAHILMWRCLSEPRYFKQKKGATDQ